MKFANKEDEDLEKKVGEFLFKVHEERKHVINELWKQEVKKYKYKFLWVHSDND
jgi:chaperonin cofactor prefoldin